MYTSIISLVQNLLSRRCHVNRTVRLMRDLSFPSVAFVISSGPIFKGPSRSLSGEVPKRYLEGSHQNTLARAEGRLMQGYVGRRARLHWTNVSFESPFSCHCHQSKTSTKSAYKQVPTSVTAVADGEPRNKKKISAPVYLEALRGPRKQAGMDIVPWDQAVGRVE